MALHVGGGSDPDEPILSEINVTPLVDVMLVLLVIFMITAPMLHQGIEVALPRAAAENLPTRIDDPLVLSINRDGLVYLQDTPIHPSQLVERLLPVLEARAEQTVFLKGDRDVAYGTVIEVLDLLRRGGIVNIGMITEQDREAGGAGSRRGS
ncbi:MAG TPA: protein TolR [Thermoanaerobaculia bacterium]|nr:protein TolR [Thermoanaerobaculia bacterium]